MQKTNPVELHVAVALPGMLARDATMHVLKAIAAATPPYDRITFALGLRDCAGKARSTSRLQTINASFRTCTGPLA